MLTVFFSALGWAGLGQTAGPPDPKVYFIWVPEVGTSRGHEPIMDQSCGAVTFSPYRPNRDLSASDLPGAI